MITVLLIPSLPEAQRDCRDAVLSILKQDEINASIPSPLDILCQLWFSVGSSTLVFHACRSLLQGQEEDKPSISHTYLNFQMKDKKTFQVVLRKPSKYRLGAAKCLQSGVVRV